MTALINPLKPQTQEVQQTKLCIFLQSLSVHRTENYHKIKATHRVNQKKINYVIVECEVS